MNQGDWTGAYSEFAWSNQLSAIRNLAETVVRNEFLVGLMMAVEYDRSPLRCISSTARPGESKKRRSKSKHLTLRCFNYLGAPEEQGGMSATPLNCRRTGNKCAGEGREEWL